MEKYGDISVKKCDFIEVYPRFLVHSTKNLYKEKTGTRVGIWEKSVCKHTAKETSDRELEKFPYLTEWIWMDKGRGSKVSRSGEKGWNDDNSLSSLAVSP